MTGCKHEGMHVSLCVCVCVCVCDASMMMVMPKGLCKHAVGRPQR